MASTVLTKGANFIFGDLDFLHDEIDLSASDERKPLGFAGLEAGLRSKADGCPFRRGQAVKAENGAGAGRSAATTRVPFSLALALTVVGRSAQQQNKASRRLSTVLARGWKPKGRDALAVRFTTAAEAPVHYP